MDGVIVSWAGEGGDWIAAGESTGLKDSLSSSVHTCTRPR